MEAIITGMTSVGSCLTASFGMVTGNPLLAFFLSVSLVGVGFKVFKHAKGAAGAH
jgi:type III secretory pathway component EscV